MSKSPLTADEVAWAAAHPDLVRQLMAQAPQPSAIAPETIDPVLLAAAKLTGALRSQLREIAAKRVDYQDDLDTFTALRDRQPDPEAMAEAERVLAERAPKLQRRIADCDTHRDTLLAKIQRLETDPKSMFLPIGTVVRFRDVPVIQDSLSVITTSAKEYPVAGTIGVVTKLCHEGEYPIGVSIRRPFQDGYGTVTPSEENLPTYRCDPERLEVIGPGLLPNGQPCTAYGFVPTHARKEGDGEPEMILRADGYFWRIHGFSSGTCAVGLVHETLAAFNWIAGPLPQYRQPTTNSTEDDLPTP